MAAGFRTSDARASDDGIQHPGGAQVAAEAMPYIT
jgi:hypothetical protein